jgi:SAM-dependent methyltransferase
VEEFVSLLERMFAERPLRVWDLCCGAGRHTEAMAARGLRVFASDNAPRGVTLTRERLAGSGLVAETAEADMTVCPWAGVLFHGVVSWDALHHNMACQVDRAVRTVSRQLVDGGWFLATLKSDHADGFGVGEEIEPGTFVQSTGAEAGVPHHYFDETGIRTLFRDWELAVLVERRCEYRERSQDFLDVNPFDYTVWGVLARKPRGSGRITT